MVKNLNILKSHGRSTDLLEELQHVLEKIKKERKGGNSNAIGLVRVIEDMSLEDWSKISERFRVDEWLAVPLSKDKAEAIQDILNFQEKIAFQRDHDPLTSLANRRYFFSTLDTELKRSERTGHELGLILIDLDDFKRVNDTYGHICGDLVLKRLAKLLKESVRSYDLVGRLGGEEFLILQPDTSIIASAIVADDIRRSFADEIFICDDNSFSVTLSAGVTSNKLVKEYLSPESLLNSADLAMYRAKKQGKNCIVAAGSAAAKQDRESLVGTNEKHLLCKGFLPDNI